MTQDAQKRPALPSGAVEAARNLPVCPEAENAALGAALKDNRLVDDLAALLCEDDFATDASRKLYHAVTSGGAVDLVILAERLKAAGHLEDVGGYTALAGLWDACPAPSNLRHYAQIARDHATRRRLIEAAGKILDSAYSPTGSARELVDEAARRVGAVDLSARDAEPASMDEVLDRTITAIDARISAGVSPGLPYGVAGLDQMTGGMHEGELIFIGARPSMGKTATALCFGKSAAKAKRGPVLFCSLEQREVELGERILAAEAQQSLRVVRSHEMSLDTQELLLQARNTLAGLPFHVLDRPRQSVRAVCAAARRMKTRRGLALLMVDYLGLLDHGKPDPRRRDDQVIGDTCKALRLLAQELRISVLLLAQLNREVEGRGKNAKPKLSDFKGSGEIEADADVAILLHVEPERKADRVWPLELILAKQRNGPTGEVLARFIPSQMRFEAEASPFGEAE